jgi:hypothetical protein
VAVLAARTEMEHLLLLVVLVVVVLTLSQALLILAAVAGQQMALGLTVAQEL